MCLIFHLGYDLKWATSDTDLMWLSKLSVPVFVLHTCLSVREERGLLGRLCSLCRSLCTGVFAVYAQSDQCQAWISREDGLIHCPSFHKAVFKHVKRCCSLAENINAYLDLSSGAVQHPTLTACLSRNETALCNSLMALKAFKTVCGSSLYQNLLFFIFHELNNQDKATFPFLQCISLLLRPFCRALFAGMKDVILLRYSQDLCVTGSWSEVLPFHFCVLSSNEVIQQPLYIFSFSPRQSASHFHAFINLPTENPCV